MSEDWTTAELAAFARSQSALARDVGHDATAGAMATLARVIEAQAARIAELERVRIAADVVAYSLCATTTEEQAEMNALRAAPDGTGAAREDGEHVD